MLLCARGTLQWDVKMKNELLLILTWIRIYAISMLIGLLDWFCCANQHRAYVILVCGGDTDRNLCNRIVSSFLLWNSRKMYSKCSFFLWIKESRGFDKGISLRNLEKRYWRRKIIFPFFFVFFSFFEKKIFSEISNLFDVKQYLKRFLSVFSKENNKH